MTKRELHQHISDFINSRDNSYPNEWYCTEQELDASIMEEFRSYIEPKQQKKQNNV